MQKLTFTSTKEREAFDITKIVNDLLIKNGFEKGLVNLFPTHTTCALTIVDLEKTKEEGYYDAYKTFDKGIALTIPVESATMALGHLQKVVLLEFSGPRERHIILTFISEKK